MIVVDGLVVGQVGAARVKQNAQIISIEPFTASRRGSNFCSPWRSPPAINATPRLTSRLEVNVPA